MALRIASGALILIFAAAALCTADAVTLKSGEVINGDIVEVESGEILMRAEMGNDTMTISFKRSQIAGIEFEESELATGFKIFDKLLLAKNTSFLGLAELEMPDAIYFSLKLKRGLGIVKFPRKQILGIEGSMGLGKSLARIYFGWKMFAYKVKTFILEKVMRRKVSRLSDKKVTGMLDRLKEENRRKKTNEIMERLRTEEITSQEADRLLSALDDDRKVYNAEDFKNEFAEYLSMEKEELYKLGVKHKCLMLGMGHDSVRAAWGRPGDVLRKEKGECWYYPNGNKATFKKGALSGYSKGAGRLSDLLKRYYSDLLR